MYDLVTSYGIVSSSILYDTSLQKIRAWGQAASVSDPFFVGNSIFSNGFVKNLFTPRWPSNKSVMHVCFVCHLFTGTFDVQHVGVVERSPLVFIECEYARNSRANGCCVKSTSVDIQPLKILRHENGNSGEFGPLDNGTYLLIITDLEHDSRECSLEVAAVVNVTISFVETSDRIATIGEI